MIRFAHDILICLNFLDYAVDNMTDDLIDTDKREQLIMDTCHLPDLRTNLANFRVDPRKQALCKRDGLKSPWSVVANYCMYLTIFMAHDQIIDLVAGLYLI